MEKGGGEMIARGTITIKRNLKSKAAQRRNRMEEDKLLKLLAEWSKPSRYRAERLPNGLVYVFDYATKWHALYTPAGEFHSGEITIPFSKTR